jgi:hypothetical protein
MTFVYTLKIDYIRFSKVNEGTGLVQENHTKHYEEKLLIGKIEDLLSSYHDQERKNEIKIKSFQVTAFAAEYV